MKLEKYPEYDCNFYRARYELSECNQAVFYSTSKPNFKSKNVLEISIKAVKKQTGEPVGFLLIQVDMADSEIYRDSEACRAAIKQALNLKTDDFEVWSM